jgi:hypothetical protein
MPQQMDNVTFFSRRNAYVTKSITLTPVFGLISKTNRLTTSSMSTEKSMLIYKLHGLKATVVFNCQQIERDFNCGS